MKIAGVILAGGKSTRMNTDKSNLMWHGQSLLERQRNLLAKSLGLENVFVSGKSSDPHSIIDREQSLGPIEGLRSVLQKFVAENIYQSLIVLPVDMPLLGDYEIEQLQNCKTDKQALFFNHYQLPVRFNDLVSILNKIEDIKTKSNLGLQKYSFKSLYQALSCHSLDVNHMNAFINTNTPEEWHVALSKADSFATDR